MLVFLFQKDYLRAFIILIIFGSISFLSLLVMYMNGVYISLGYLWTPFLSFFIFLIIYHLRVISKEQQVQEKLLIRQSKLASMGEMISLIAHQWRQPLSAINGTVLNMDIDYRKEKLSDEKFDKYLNDIEATTAYLSKTINDFTDFFSRTKEAERFHISSVIAQAKILALLSSSNDIDLVYLNRGDIEMKGYASELIQSILVLLNNAIYICKENLETIERGNILIDVVQSNKKVAITVEDNGGGIKKTDIKKIFDPYFTTKEKHNGTGLGLYIVKLIIEDSMDGKIFVHNGKKGAIFTIEIPIELK
jgi:signal transduction histidine kinase